MLTTGNSGVLAASIELSRQKLKEGAFDRYWEKPTKKKTVFEAPNPPKETMTRVGACSLIIEPHVFDITLYTVKENPIAYAAPQPPPLSSPQYNPFATAATYPPYNYNTPPTPPKYQSQKGNHSSQTTLPPFREGFAQFGPQGPPPMDRAPIPVPASIVDPKLPSLPAARSTGQQVGAKDQNGEPKQDPVIQMLATRAASDHGLKTLMKVVASGQASETQLKDFQDHIDELNTLLKSQPISTEPSQDESRPQPPPRSGQEHLSVVVPTSTPDNSWTQIPSTAPYSTPAAKFPPIKTEPSAKIQSFTAPSVGLKSPYTVHKPEISSIVFDFGGTGDRFSFPRFSILEYLYGGTQVIVSFLVIRRGSTAKPEKYKDNRNYYQPVTMRLSTSHPKVLEPLAKVVAPPDEVRRYMDSVFDKMSPADTVFLATRLPRAGEPEGTQKPDSIPQADPQADRRMYSPPNSIMPLAS